jgi:ubiquinone/menaquinone biosynthesis C-methylase UbiE
MPMTPHPTERFSDRVDDYVRHRPSYPPQAVEAVIDFCQLEPGDRVADIGSGTGIFAALLLERRLQVAAVEPNEPMRAAAERMLGDPPGFSSVAGRAEATTLPDAGVKAVTAAQAFHWFDRPAARLEFQRILQPDGCVALLWNDRRTDATAFLRDYEQLLHTHGTDYSQIDHKNISDAQFRDFFSPGRFVVHRFDNRQTFDYEALLGRVRSSSYIPGPDHPGFGPMIAELRRLFDRHQHRGQVAFEYDTLVYCGRFV